MLDIVAMMQALAELAKNSLVRRMVIWMAPRLVTAAFFVMMLSGVLAWREGSIKGFVNHYIINSLQHEILNVAGRDPVIQERLNLVLDAAPTAARVRLAQIHNGTVNPAGIGMLRFDVTHGVVRGGYAVGNLPKDAPLADWAQYLRTLLAGECHAVAFSEMTSAAQKARMAELHVGYRVACPVISYRGDLLGALFITWQEGVRPSNEEVKSVEAASLRFAPDIATLLTVGK